MPLAEILHAALRYTYQMFNPIVWLLLACCQRVLVCKFC